MTETAFSLPQLVGYAAFVLGVVAFAQKNDGRLKILNAVQAAVYCAHFVLLGSMPAAAGNFVNIFRNLAFLRKRSPYAVAALLALTLALAIATVRSPLGLFAIAASVVAIVGMYRYDGIALRLCLLCCTFLWLTNNILCHSIGGIMLEVTTGTTNLITIRRILMDGRGAAGPFGANRKCVSPEIKSIPEEPIATQRV
ncbi:MAG: YgjV family protein [Capsulimonadaceae bacterium]|nr:YgjV family protein [Capsulimonadaceae bacterium]